MNFYDWNTYFGLVGILGVVFSIWQYYKTKSEIKLTLYIQELIPIISDSLNSFKGIKIAAVDNEIPLEVDVYHIRFFLKNTGNVDISKQKVFEKIKINLLEDLKIIDFSIKAYPSSITESTLFDKNSNEFTTDFALLRKGEFIQYDVIIHLPQEIKKEKKLKYYRQVENYILGNTAIEGRIENCKKFEFLRLKQEKPSRTLIGVITALALMAIFISALYLIMLKPFRIEKNLVRDIVYKDVLYSGRIDFLNTDTFIITENFTNEKLIVPRKVFELTNGRIGPLRETRKPVGIFFLLFGGLFLAYLISIYSEFNKARNKKAILDFIKEIDTFI